MSMLTYYTDPLRAHLQAKSARVVSQLLPPSFTVYTKHPLQLMLFVHHRSLAAPFSSTNERHQDFLAFNANGLFSHAPLRFVTNVDVASLASAANVDTTSTLL